MDRRKNHSKLRVCVLCNWFDLAEKTSIIQMSLLNWSCKEFESITIFFWLQSHWVYLGFLFYLSFLSTSPSLFLPHLPCSLFLLKHTPCILEAGSALWWEHLPPTNVAEVQFPHSVSYVDWVCWFSTLHREVFPQLLQFSSLIKNQHLTWFGSWNNHFKIMIWVILISCRTLTVKQFDHIICTIEILNIV